MGVYSNSVAMTQFRVSGDIPANEQFRWYSEKFSLMGFRSIENGSEQLSEGWTRTDQPDDPAFEVPGDFWRDDYILVSIRCDQRKIPSSLFRFHLSREETAFLAGRPDLHRTPKGKMQEMKEMVHVRLMAKTLPVPSTTDLVWNTGNGILTIFSCSGKTLERFETLFRKTFESFHLVPVHPFARAEMLLEGKSLELLHKANRANSDSVAALIAENRWIGEDFQLWLLYRSLNGEGDFRISLPGRFSGGEPFSAWIDERILLQGGSDDGGVQKVSVSGSQDSYSEAITSLRGGKTIKSSTICLEKGEDIWKLTLRGDTFDFASFKAPAIRIERDDSVDAGREREAAFYERMLVVEQGLQLFDSLFAAFLQERVNDSWSERASCIHKWLETS